MLTLGSIAQRESIALMINEAFGSEETSTVSVHVIPERELDKLMQKTERLNKPSYAFADQHGSSEEKAREITLLTSELQATKQEIKKLKAQQESYAHAELSAVDEYLAELKDITLPKPGRTKEVAEACG